MQATRAFLIPIFSVAMASVAWAGPTLTTLVSFDGTNGIGPGGAVVDSAGNLFGTCQNGNPGNGSCFELSGADHKVFTRLANFQFPATAGYIPTGARAVDSAGNIYGTTYWSLEPDTGKQLDGSIYMQSAADRHTIDTLAVFNGVNGSHPFHGVVADGAGNLFGTTTEGGANGLGNIFELSGSDHKTLSTLLDFNGANGTGLTANIAIDKSGRIFGTASTNEAVSRGIVFQLSGADHKALSTIATFDAPASSLTVDSTGNLYCNVATDQNGAGSVVKISGENHDIVTLLHDFTGPDGSSLDGPVLTDAAGNLFGTALYGGSGGAGVLFELSGSDQKSYTALYNFDVGSGLYPVGNLVADTAGNIYGTTFPGSNIGSQGTVFELSGTNFVVPEPASLGICAVGIALLCRRRCSSSDR